MDDVTRLFRLLVGVLADADPAQLRQPFRVAELHERILPYRRFKRDLKFDAIEDYEMAVLRLLAGDGGYAAVEPLEAREALCLEADAVHPDTGAFRAFGDATVQLDHRAVQSVLNEEWAYAPPTFPLPDTAGPSPPGERADESAGRPVFEAVDDGGERMPPEPRANRRGACCPQCEGTLPEGRSLAYCPYCGHRLGARACTSCGEPVETGWQFCGACGRPVGA